MRLHSVDKRGWAQGWAKHGAARRFEKYSFSKLFLFMKISVKYFQFFRGNFPGISTII